MQLILTICTLLALAWPAWAQNIGSGSGGGGTSLTVKENDGTPSVPNVNSISFTNGTVTNDGGGAVSVTISGTGAPLDATYITQTSNATLTNEQALGALTTGCVGVTTTTGVLNSRVLTGTANQITVTNGNCAANPTLSIPTNPTLPGTTTGTFSGNLTGNVTGNADTSTALAADPTDCSAGSATTGINASGTAQGCTNYTEEPGSNGLVARTAANTTAARTLTGTANEVSVANGDGAAGNPTISLPATVDLTSKTLRIPNSTTLPGTCTVGDMSMDTDATSGQRLYLCQAANTWVLQGDGGGGGGGIGGTVGTTDNAIPRADGTGGSTLQASGCTISDTNVLTCPGGFVGGTSGTGTVTLLEGTAPGAGTNAGEHNLYFNSISLLQSHKNGGSAVTYYSTANFPTALAANGANCSSGSFPLGVDASGASENCTALPTAINGTANEIAASASTGNITLSIPSTLNLTSKTVRIPNGTTLPGTCTVGDMSMDTDATSGLRLYLCESANTWTAQGSGGGTGLTSLAGQTGNVQTITRGTGIGGSSSSDNHTFTFDATELGSLSWSNGASASFTDTYNVSGTDTVVTHASGVWNLSTGNLQEGGNDVFTTGAGEINAVTAKTIPTTSDLLLIEDAAASNAKKKSTLDQVLAANDARTKTLTNTTLDAEATGNTITIPFYWDLDLAGVSGGTASHIWNDDPLSTACTPNAVTGTNRTTAVCTFPDTDGDFGRQITRYLPDGWTGSFDAEIWWKTTGTGNARFQIATKCYADDDADDASFNTASIVTAAAGTSGRPNKQSISGMTTTGCTAGQLMRIRFYRNRTEGSDTLNAALDVEKVVFKGRAAH